MAKRPVKKTTMKDLEAKAHELLDVSARRKALEKREDELKEVFKADCGGKPFLYDFGSVVVETALDTRTTVDGKAVRDEFGEKFDKTSTFMRVIAREAKEISA